MNERAEDATRRMVVLLVLALSVVLAACTPRPTPKIPVLGVDNGTTLPVTIAVNGTIVDTVPPNSQRSLSPGAFPALPWNVQALSPRGRVLLELEVVAGAVSDTSDGNGGASLHGAADRVDLSCGRLDIYAGPPLAGPMPGPGTPGDCEP